MPTAGFVLITGHRQQARAIRVADPRLAALYRKPNTSKRAPEHTIYPSCGMLSITRANYIWAMDNSYIPMARGNGTQTGGPGKRTFRQRSQASGDPDSAASSMIKADDQL